MDDWQQWVTLVVLLAMLAGLVREWISPAAGTLGALVVLVLAGVVDAPTAFAGYADPATLTVAGLFVVARAVRDHGRLGPRIGRLMGDGSRPRRSLVRMVVPTAAASGVIANTPLVAALAPVVRDWAERNGRPVSRYLIPVSFAAILGGTLTTIGTSPTLLVSGLVGRETGQPFGLLEVTPVGLPVALATGVLLCVLGPRLLPDRSTSQQQIAASERDYTLPLRVRPDGPIDGVRVADAGLRSLKTVYLARIQRGAREIAPVGPDEVLRGEDVLVFVGRVDEVSGLTSRPGLTHADESQVTLLDGERHDRFEVVIGRDSSLVGRTLKDISFRGRYGGVVLAVHRAGRRVDHKLGTVRLEPGASLLLQSRPGFDQRWSGRGDFAVIVPLDEDTARAGGRGALVLATVAGMVLAAALGLVPILTAVVAACAALIVTRTVSFFAAKDALDLDVLIVIGSAIGLGSAVESSGLAATVASGLLTVVPDAGAVPGLGPAIIALAGVVITTLVLTELVTNVAAAALMVPIALDLATRVDADPRGFAVAVAVAASSSYLTPIGYQTNTIVYGLGGYRFTDYWRLGAPMTAAVVVTILVVVPLVWS